MAKNSRRHRGVGVTGEQPRVTPGSPSCCRMGGLLFFSGKDYTFRAEVFMEVVDHMGVGIPVIDVFANQKNTRCPEFWNQEHNAFDQLWQGQGLLWLNPPSLSWGKLYRKSGQRVPNVSSFVPTGQANPGGNPYMLNP